MQTAVTSSGLWHKKQADEAAAEEAERVVYGRIELAERSCEVMWGGAGVAEMLHRTRDWSGRSMPLVLNEIKQCLQVRGILERRGNLFVRGT